MKKVIKDNNLCDNAPYCGAKRFCPTEAIIYDSGIRQIVIDEDKCIGCGKCVRACPHYALSIAEK